MNATPPPQPRPFLPPTTDKRGSAQYEDGFGDGIICGIVAVVIVGLMVLFT